MRMLKLNKIHNIDALQGLKQLPDNYIDCSMSSSPYWALRDYGTAKWEGGDSSCNHFREGKHLNANTGQKNIDSGIGDGIYKEICKKCGAKRIDMQLGLEPTFDEYINKLCDIYDEVKRVLKPTGTCWVNLGDTYSGAGAGQKDTGKAVYEGSDFRKTPTKTRLEDKSLLLIPFRFAIEMQNRGWILRNTIIWHKPNCMPSSAKDRFTVDFEYVFFFVKQKKYFFETQYDKTGKEASWDEYNKADGRRHFHQDDMGKGMLQYNPDFKPMTHPLGRNKRTVWSICPQPFPEAHFAVYPEELCQTPLKSGCPAGGIVLDPFMGAGTTALVALKQNKRFIGFEINKQYIDIANKRIKPYLEQTKLEVFK